MTFYVTNVETRDHAAAGKVATQAKAGVYRNYLKPIFENLLILAALPVVLPLIAIMAFLVALDGGNPFYSQLRIGKGGRIFRIWKLRTMITNADDVLEEHLAKNAEARAEWNENQKLKDDPRITTVGRILRKFSFDELPQLWNVVNGTMSLVGPRPMMVCQQGDYLGRAYYNLRPGITGFWQVLDRNATAFSARVKHDDAYDREVSLVTDVRLLAMTFGVVVRGTGY